MLFVAHLLYSLCSASGTQHETRKVLFFAISRIWDAIQTISIRAEHSDWPDLNQTKLQTQPEPNSLCP